jgi:hypothetical protein
MKITDDMIIPTNYRGFNHGRTNLEIRQALSDGYCRQAHLYSGLAEFGRSSRLGDVGAELGEGRDTSNFHHFFVCSSQSEGV